MVCHLLELRLLIRNHLDLVSVDQIPEFDDYKIMDNLLIENKVDDNYSLRKLTKYYAYLLAGSLFLLNGVGIIIFIVLLIQIKW